LTFSAAAATTALAQDKPSAKKSVLDLAKLKTELESGSEPRIMEALRTIEHAGKEGASAAPLVDALLGRGASVSVSLAAIKLAASLRQQASSSAIAPYVRHRSPEVRLAAVHALVETNGPVAAQALRQALRCNDPAIRAVAPAGLVRLGDRSAVPELLVALDRGLLEAAPAVGQLCSAAQCSALGARFGRVPLQPMLDASGHVLGRADVPDEAKIELIAKIGARSEPAARQFLARQLERHKTSGSARVREALEKALRGQKQK
jgi:HEAT repeat protein